MSRYTGPKVKISRRALRRAGGRKRVRAFVTYEYRLR